MAAPTPEELRVMLANQSGDSMTEQTEQQPSTDSYEPRIGFESTTSSTNPTGEPKNASDRPWPEVLPGDFVLDDGIKRLNLQGQSLPQVAWLPLDNEIDEQMKDKLIMALIDYCEKLGGGTRFKSAAQAYSYFAIKSDKQLDRMNELVKKIKEAEEQKAEPIAVISDANLGISPNTTPSRFVYKEGEIPKTIRMDHEGNVTTEEPEELPEPLKPLSGNASVPEPVEGNDPAPPSAGS